MGQRKKRRKTIFNPPTGKNSKKYFARRRKLYIRLKHYAQVSTPNYGISKFEAGKFIVFKKLKEKVLNKSSLSDTGKILFHDNVYNDGYRLINLDILRKHVLDISLHSATCKDALLIALDGKSPVKLFAEEKRWGLASVMKAQCIGCNKVFMLNTSDKISTTSAHKRFDINVRAVWGTVASGGGACNLNEMMGTMGAYGMTQASFTAIEDEISEWWRQVMEEEMLAAGQEELRLAVQRNDFHEGVPAITVVIDGGWSKRSHKHSYNALGGVAVIIGHETKKLLHVGVRNKYCYLCTLSETRHNVAPEHKCFRNWDESSAAMESDIILQGFFNAEKVHGLRYMRIVGDGDSSVYVNIQEKGPAWGKNVTKLECANHVCKCLRSNLEKLVDNNPSYKGKGRLTRNVRKRLTTAVRCAIKMRSEESDKKLAIRKLERDIRNSVYHIFGEHSNCSSDFCKNKNENALDSNCQNTDKTMDEDENSDSVICDQVSIWKDVTDESQYDEGRCGFYTSYEDIDKSMLEDITALLNRTASKSSRLIENFTTNICEAWMHIRTKFDGGKMFNRSGRGSWNIRCYGSALRQNLGPAWSPYVWNKCTDTQASKPFFEIYRQRSMKHYTDLRIQSKVDIKQRARKRKQERERVSTTKKARKEYGEEVLDQMPDVDVMDLERECKSYYEKVIVVSEKKAKDIERSTVKQTRSSVWCYERKKRLTSSVFGEVYKRNTSKPVKPLVRKLLYSKFAGNKFTAKGLKEERNTLQEYILEKAKDQENVSVSQSGLVIDSKHHHLATTPDGIVSTSSGEKGLVEVKNLLQNNKYSIRQACSKVPSFCLQICNGRLQLKQNHNYYFQCRGQLNICNLPWVDFVVRRTEPHDIFIERIYRNKNIWSLMVPKLNSFYYKALLPELTLPREGKHPGIREPGIWFEEKRSLTRTKTRKKGSTFTSSSSLSPKPGPSHINPSSVSARPQRRASRQKFVGRRILHKWLDNNVEKWYEGVVLSVISGIDGQDNTEYEVQYHGEKSPNVVENLHLDLAEGSLKFIDC